MALNFCSSSSNIYRAGWIVFNSMKGELLKPNASLCVLNCRGVKRYVVPVKKIMLNRKLKMGPQPPQPRNTYIEWNYDSELYAFGKRLGEEFNKDYLQQAFVERSYIIMEEEKQKIVGIDNPVISLKDNAEFANKGELLIEGFSKRYLRTVYPRLPEEGICSISDYLLSENVLADISKNIGTSDIILSSTYPPSSVCLANVLKAIVYALELSSGKDKATIFIRDFIITYLSGKDINELWHIKEPELILSDILAKEKRGDLEPRLIAEAGRNTILAAFQVGLYSDKNLVGIGFGETINIAKENAAVDALKRMFCTNERSKPIPFDLVLPSDENVPFANISVEDWCEKLVKSV